MICVYDVIPLQPRFGFIQTSIAFLYVLVHLHENCCKCYAIFSLSYTEHVKVFNPFPSKKLNEFLIWKEKKRIPNVII